MQEETDGLGVQRIECVSRESGKEGLQNAGADQGSRSLITECHRQPYVRVCEGRFAKSGTKSGRRPRWTKSQDRVLPAVLRESLGKKVCRGQKKAKVDGVKEPGATGSPE